MTKRDKCAQTQKNRIVIHKNNTERRIYKQDLEACLEEGWTVGPSEKHLKNISAKHIGKTPWNRDTKGVMKANKTTWKKGHTPHNKGDKLINNISEKLKHAIIECYCKEENSITACSKRFNIPKYTIYGILKESGSIRDKKQASRNRSESTLRIKVTKDYLTKKKNNSFNKSKPEELLYEELLRQNVNKTIYRQYKDDKRYPFYCDFYIVEDDLFIELNAHWSHGGHPFDENNPEDIEKLNIWKERAKTSQFYKAAIETWTIRDVLKLEAAKKNNLNYKVIY